MLKFGQGFGDVVGHGKVNCFGLVVPMEGEATVKRAGPVGGDGVEGGKSGDKVVGMFFTDVSNSKVVDNQREAYGACAVGVETRRGFGR